MIILRYWEDINDIPKDQIKDGWIPSAIARPVPYDMVLIKEHAYSSTLPGWWTGSSWWGYRIDPDIKYKFWKREEK